MDRIWSMPNKWTFKIKPIKSLIMRYVGEPMFPRGKWVDPFAGENSPAQITNDLNPKMPTTYHLDALEFAKGLPEQYDGILFDPPYSLRQLKECYENLGISMTQKESNSFWSDIKNELATAVKPGGIVISFGWNSNGLGLKRGFEIEEILLVAHGREHNDTIVTVERKQK